MLFDKRTKKVTAILDFDFCCVCNPFDEFWTILSDLGCNITNKDDVINAAIISGDFTIPPKNPDEESANRWKHAKAWNAAMKKMGVVSSSDIDGADRIRDMALLQTLLCPFQLSSENSLRKMDDAEKAELRANTEADLDQWLKKHGL